MSTRKISFFIFICAIVYYKKNIKHFPLLIYSYINTRGNWENSKLCENTPPFGRRVSTQFLVVPIPTRVDINVLYLLNKIHLIYENTMCTLNHTSKNPPLYPDNV